MGHAPADTRVFLFHSADAKANPSAAMDAVNNWLGKDRTAAQYPNLEVQDITITPDGGGGIYTLIVVDLGRKKPSEQDEDV